jgi:hypothetical protein
MLTMTIRLSLARSRALRVALMAVLTLGGIALLGAQPQATSASGILEKLKVISGSSSSISCGTDQPWSKIHTDLNKGAGGKYIYASITHSPGQFDAWNLVSAVAGSSPSVSCHGSDVKIDGAHNYGEDGNLNQGSGGKHIYFCMRQFIHPHATLYGISFIVISGSTPEWLAKSSATTACYLRHHDGHPYIDLQDLNDGARGAFIYTCGSQSHS